MDFNKFRIRLWMYFWLTASVVPVGVAHSQERLLRETVWDISRSHDISWTHDTPASNDQLQVDLELRFNFAWDEYIGPVRRGEPAVTRRVGADDPGFLMTFQAPDPIFDVIVSDMLMTEAQFSGLTVGDVIRGERALGGTSQSAAPGGILVNPRDVTRVEWRVDPSPFNTFPNPLTPSRLVVDLNVQSTLRVYGVPEPAGSWLLLLALLSVVMSSRHHRPTTAN